MKKFFKSFRYGQRGFTLLELLIVIAVLGALAAVVVPSVAAFLKTANLAAANTEVQNVKTGAMAFLADNGRFPTDATELMDFGTSATDYLSKACEGTYEFDPNSGQITVGTPVDGTITEGLDFDVGKQMWVRP